MLSLYIFILIFGVLKKLAIKSIQGSSTTLQCVDNIFYRHCFASGVFSIRNTVFEDSFQKHS